MQRMILFLIALSAPLAAQDYCSLEVRVVNQKGNLVPNVMVRAAEEDGLAKQTERHDGVVRFCDFGTRPVHVRVGSSGCLDIKIENVQLEWRKTRYLTVTFQDEYCNVDKIRVGPRVCYVLLRFVNEEEKPLPGVALVPLPQSTSPARSDLAGRIMLTVTERTPARASAVLQDYSPVPIEETCSSQQSTQRDRFITLEKQ